MNPNIAKPNGPPKKGHAKSWDGSVPRSFIELPDVRQDTNYTCGSSEAFAICQWYGVGPKTLKEMTRVLGTTKQKSTDPMTIVGYLSRLGLDAVPRHGMSVDDLREAWTKGQPVLCCVQEYGGVSTSEKYGHYLTVVGVDHGYVFVSDPSADNALEKDPATTELPLGGSQAAPGRSMIREDRWMKMWHDQGADGNEYVRFGIVVGPGRTGKPASKVEQEDVPPNEEKQFSRQLVKSVVEHAADAVRERSVFSNNGNGDGWSDGWVDMPSSSLKSLAESRKVLAGPPIQESGTKANVVNVYVPEQRFPDVVVNVPRQETPNVTVNVPKQAPPNITVDVPDQPAPIVNVNVPPAQPAKETKTAKRLMDGTVVITTERDQGES